MGRKGGRQAWQQSLSPRPTARGLAVAIGEFPTGFRPHPISGQNVQKRRLSGSGGVIPPDASAAFVAIPRTEPSSKNSNQGDVCAKRECVVRRSADHPPTIGPMEKGVAAVGRSCDRVRSPFRKRAAAADRTVGAR
jgi:hypothetical protein